MLLANSLEQLGFDEKEQAVYLALTDLGRVSPTVLAKRTNIPRATLYAVLESLSDKGVVAREQGGRTTFYLASNPIALLRLVEREREAVKAKESVAQELVDYLLPLAQGKDRTIPKLQIFEGATSVENMLYDYLPLWRESYSRVGDFTLWGYQDPTFVESYLKWHHHMWESRDPRETIHLFSNAADLEQELSHRIPKREVRALPAGVVFRSSIWIYGDYIVLGMTRQNPHYVVQIKDEIFGSNLRTIFELLWKAKF